MATTWTKPEAAFDADRVRVSKATCTTTTEAPTNRGAYAAGTAYVANDLVSFAGAWWWCILAGTGHQPDTSPTYWVKTSQLGIDLKGLQGVNAVVEMAAGNIGAGASLVAYLVNPATGAMVRAPDYDKALTAGSPGQGCARIALGGSSGRLVVLPNTLGGATAVYLLGSPQAALLGA